MRADDTGKGGVAADQSHDDDDDTANGFPPNEILAEAHEHKRRRDAAAATPEPGAARRWPGAIGLALGVTIGSGALAAALLYANRSRR